MQCDCLSEWLFIFYLAECLSEECDNNLPLKYNLSTTHDSFNVDPFYADDTTFAGINEPGKTRLAEVEIKVPQQLATYGLTSNESKKEAYVIPRPQPPPVPPPAFDELLAHKHDKPLWGNLDFLTNYNLQ